MVWRIVSAIVGKGVVVSGCGCCLDFAGLLDLEQSIHKLVRFHRLGFSGDCGW